MFRNGFHSGQSLETPGVTLRHRLARSEPIRTSIVTWKATNPIPRTKQRGPLGSFHFKKKNIFQAKYDKPSSRIAQLKSAKARMEKHANRDEPVAL